MSIPFNKLPWPAVAGGEVGGREVMLGVTGSKMGGAAGAAGGDTGGTSWPGVVGSMIVPRLIRRLDCSS